MKGTEWARLSRTYLLPALAGYEVKGRLLFSAPVDLILAGFSCQPSAFSSEAFTVEVFAQPLYVPSDSLTFSIGGRLGRLSGGAERWWDLTATNEADVMQEVALLMQTEGLPFLRTVDTPRRVATYIRDTNREGRLPLLEDEAYSWVLTGDVDVARQRLTDAIADGRNGGVAWAQRAGSRTERVLAALEEGIDQAIQVLHEWRDHTLRALHLEAYAVQPT